MFGTTFSHPSLLFCFGHVHDVQDSSHHITMRQQMQRQAKTLGQVEQKDLFIHLFKLGYLVSIMCQALILLLEIQK